MSMFHSLYQITIIHKHENGRLTLNRAQQLFFCSRVPLHFHILSQTPNIGLVACQLLSIFHFDGFFSYYLYISNASFYIGGISLHAASRNLHNTAFYNKQKEIQKHIENG